MTARWAGAEQLTTLRPSRRGGTERARGYVRPARAGLDEIRLAESLTRRAIACREFRIKRVLGPIEGRGIEDFRHRSPGREGRAAEGTAQQLLVEHRIAARLHGDASAGRPVLLRWTTLLASRDGRSAKVSFAAYVISCVSFCGRSSFSTEMRDLPPYGLTKMRNANAICCAAARESMRRGRLA